jgi:large subunit ribosomal protein L4
MSSLSIPIYNLSGKTVGTAELSPAIFGFKLNPALLHQAVVSHLANRRATTAHTKDRGEVAGSGKKPWRQKGTGRARAGSVRSPLWIGGGITFGPSNERNYSLRMPQKMRQAAFKTALSAKVVDGSLIVIDSLSELDGKTKSWAQAVTQLPKASRALVVSEAKEDIVDRSIRNAPTQKYVGLDGLTVYDIVRFPTLIMTQSAVEALTKRLDSEMADKEEPKPTKKRAVKA